MLTASEIGIRAHKEVNNPSRATVPKYPYTPYGGVAKFYSYEGVECVLAGPYETGKTLGVINRLHDLMWRNKNAQALMLRKTYKSLLSSAVVTFEKKVLPVQPGVPGCPITKYGKSRPEWYTYPNGARLMLGGMDNADKFLSSEFDYIYVNQLEELTLEDYELLTGRATGRAGNVEFTQIMADCNPAGPHHWILGRERLRLFESRHEDNPVLFDPVTGELTEQGIKTMDALSNLTGVRYKRGRLGLWVASEGQVYEDFDPAVHVIDRFEIPDSWNRYRSIDFGFNNPFVCQWWAEDHDGRLYLYREIYMTQRTVRVHSEQIKRLSEGERILRTIADHDAEDRATLAENGISTEAAAKDISRGIQAVQERLKIQGDGKPRLFILRDSLVEIDTALQEKHRPLSTEQEINEYVWPKGQDGRALKEVPVDDNNHGQDAKRYMVMAVTHKMAEPFVF